LGPKRVLVIDDEPAVRPLLRLVLEGDGWKVRVAGDGQQGPALGRQHHPDMVLLDVALPDISGLEICRQIKSSTDTNPTSVVMVTAMAQEADMRAALDVGADDYVTKPWRPAVPIAKVSGLVQRPRRDR